MVTVISDATNSVLASISVGSEPFGIAVDSATNFVYVGNNAQGTVSIILAGGVSTAAPLYYYLGAAFAATVAAAVTVIVVLSRRRRTRPPSG